MRKSYAITVIFWIIMSGEVRAQQIDTSFFLTLKNKEYLKYREPDGKLLGCAMSLECQTMHIVFYSIECNRQRKTISIKGRILDSGPIDSVGNPGIDIFLARPHGTKLLKIRGLGNSAFGTNGDQKINRVFPNRAGDFSFTTTFSELDRLYFIGAIEDPVEFYIGRLFKTDDL